MATRPDRWTLLSILAATAIAILLLPIGIHTDDLQVVELAGEVGYLDLWTTPFRDFYYRPLVSTLVKLGADTLGVNPILRVTQALLVFANLALFARIVRPLVGPARLTGVLCLCGAPFTFVAVAPFGVGIGDSIVALALLICVRETQRDVGRPILLIAATLLALAAKESGLLVAAYAAAELGRRRKIGWAALCLAIAGAYLAAHTATVTTRPYILRTGYFFDMLSATEQRARFGDNPLGLRIYTAASNLSSALIYLPYQGQLRLSAAIAGFAAITGGTTVITAAYLVRSGELRRSWPLLCMLPANAAIGFAYARTRIMFTAYIGIAVLFACAIDWCWRRDKRTVAIVAMIGWVGVLCSTIARMISMGL